jgi:hypothetical protein
VSHIYETAQLVQEQLIERTIRETGWVSRFRIIESVIRVVVTRVTVELMDPNGTTVVSKYATPTRYVETEYRRRTTVFLGITRIAQPVTTQPVTPPQPITTQPVPGTTTEEWARRPEPQPQPVPMPVVTIT